MEKSVLVYMGLGWAVLFFGLLIFGNVSQYENYTTGAAITNDLGNSVLSPTAVAIIIPLLLSNIVLIAILINKFRNNR